MPDNLVDCGVWQRASTAITGNPCDVVPADPTIAEPRIEWESGVPPNITRSMVTAGRQKGNAAAVLGVIRSYSFDNETLTVSAPCAAGALQRYAQPVDLNSTFA